MIQSKNIQRIFQHQPFSFIEILLRGYAAAFFCDSAFSGLLFLLSTLLLSPLGAFYAVVALIAATLTAKALRFDTFLTSIGYFSYNGGLVGLYWLFFRPVNLGSILTLIICAALTAPLTFICFRIFSQGRFNLPIFSIPSLIVTWAAIPVMSAMQIAWPPTQILPEGFEKIFEHSLGNLLLIQNYGFTIELLSGWPAFLASLIFLLGLWWYSRRIAILGVTGAFVGILTAFIVVGVDGLGWNMLYLITTAPIMIAIGGFFVVMGKSSLILGFLACLIGTGVWYGMTLVFAEIGFPVLTAPFALTSLAILFTLKSGILPQKRLGLITVPLVNAASPEAGMKWHRQLKMAESYWSSVADFTNAYHWETDVNRKMKKAAELIMRSQRIVVLTGAGISTESKIPDYRTDFLSWKKYDTSHFLWENFLASEFSRAKYWEMSQDFYLLIKGAQPNKAHYALVELEQMGKLQGIITQNVDRLHQKAGTSSDKVIELHGSELVVKCLQCGKTYPRDQVFEWINNGLKVPYCLQCQGILKPNSIAFNQPMPLDESKKAFDWVMNCDLFMVLGTSLSVQPVALLPWKAKEKGATTILITLTSTQFDEHADIIIHKQVGKTLHKIMNQVKELRDYFRIY